MYISEKPALPGFPFTKNLKRNIKELPLSGLFPQRILFANSGRSALVLGLKSLNVPRGCSVWLPAFICQSVVDALKQEGFAVRYYDIANRLEPIWDSIETKLGDIFLMVHFFGIKQDAMSIYQSCRDRGLFLVEDSTHFLLDFRNSLSLQLLSEFAVFSFRKVLPVPDGGMLLLKSNEMFCNIEKEQIQIGHPSSKKLLMMIGEKLLPKVFQGKYFRVKDVLAQFFGSTDSEISSSLKKGSLRSICHLTLNFLASVDYRYCNERRRGNFLFLAGLLRGRGVVGLPFPVLSEDTSPLAFPILVERADILCAALRMKGVGAIRWPGDQLPRDVKLEKYEGTQKWYKNLILLPIHQDVSKDQLLKMGSILADLLMVKN